MCRLAEKNINENVKEQTDTVEEDKMEYELSTDLTQKSIMTSLCSLLLQLNGDVTVLVVNMLLECVAVISNEEHSKGEEEEDREINALRVAHGQLLKIVKDLLVNEISIYLSIYLSINLLIYLYIYLLIYLYIYLSINLLIYLSIYLLIYLSIY